MTISFFVAFCFFDWMMDGEAWIDGWTPADLLSILACHYDSVRSDEGDGVFSQARILRG